MSVIALVLQFASRPSEAKSFFVSGLILTAVVGGRQEVLVIVGYFVGTAVVIWSVAYLIFGKLLNGSRRVPPEDAS